MSNSEIEIKSPPAEFSERLLRVTSLDRYKTRVSDCNEFN